MHRPAKKILQYIVILLIIIIVIIAIHTLSAGLLLASADSRQILSPENLWTKPGEHCVHTHTYTQKNPFMHTDYIYLFIYHVCMHLMKCVCEFVYRLCCKKRWHLWTYLKIKGNKQTKKPTSAKPRLVPIHTVEIYMKYLFSEVNVF